MHLADRLHCPRCKGRLTALAAVAAKGFTGDGLRCAHCEWIVPMVDGIADFVGGRPVSASDPHGCSGDPRVDDAASAELLERIRAAAGERWPVSLGEVLELGCGSGQLTRMLKLVLNAEVRGLIVTDTAMDMVRSCRGRLGTMGLALDETVLFARLSGQEDPIRDAVADTVAGTGVLSRFGDARAFLAMVHRVLKPGGRAFFMVPNRRYHQAFCQAMAAALVCRHGRSGIWPDRLDDAMRMLADMRLQLVHQGDLTLLSGLREKHVFDADALEDLAREVGFATVDVIPIDPDPLGGETTRRLCQDAGLPEKFIGELAPLVASAGAPFFSLLSRQDASAAMLLWVTKGIGPRLRTFSARPKAPATGFGEAESALGGAPPRWSLELVGRDTADGIVVSLGGWCLVNSDIRWLRLKLAGISRDAAVWHPRPDVHEVLNTRNLYHPLNALCCGVATELLFDGQHPENDRSPLQLEVVLANGLVVRGLAPETLVMNQSMVIVQ